MSTPVKAGILLGVLVVAWMLVMGYSGWYRDPQLANLFFVVILIQLVVMIWALRKTAAEGRGYGGQVVGGLVLSLVASVIIFAGSYLFTTVLFPTYFEDVRTAGERMLLEQGRTPEEARTAMEQNMVMQTPVRNALAGVVGTVLTGLFISVIAAFFIRSKGGPFRNA